MTALFRITFLMLVVLTGCPPPPPAQSRPNDPSTSGAAPGDPSTSGAAPGPVEGVKRDIDRAPGQALDTIEGAVAPATR